MAFAYSTLIPRPGQAWRRQRLTWDTRTVRSSCARILHLSVCSIVHCTPCLVPTTPAPHGQCLALRFFAAALKSVAHELLRESSDLRSGLEAERRSSKSALDAERRSSKAAIESERATSQRNLESERDALKAATDAARESDKRAVCPRFCDDFPKLQFAAGHRHAPTLPVLSRSPQAKQIASLEKQLGAVRTEEHELKNDLHKLRVRVLKQTGEREGRGAGGHREASAAAQSQL